jgi:hypothetical protein
LGLQMTKIAHFIHKTALFRQNAGFVQDMTLSVI